MLWVVRQDEDDYDRGVMVWRSYFVAFIDGFQ